ncbi:MAG: hypothetical protein NEHIOOID_00329 [Holosporales bacterium]
MKKRHLTCTFIIAHIMLFSRVFAADAQPGMQLIGDESRKGSYVCTIAPDKKQIVSHNLQEPKPLETIRLLSCTGGGTKGLLPAVMLAYLEELINLECNAVRRKEILVGLGRGKDEDDYDYLYIGDLFDGAAGTSTGGILAAGLMFNAQIDINDTKKKRYKAIEIAQVYARYCDTLFGFSLSNTIKVAGVCSEEPLEKLFSLYFGAVNMDKAFNAKHVEFFTCDNTTDATPHCLSVVGEFEETMVRTCLRSTTAVPYLYPPSTITFKRKTYIFQDGGLRTNFPGDELLRGRQNKDGQKKYELYAFGTGYSQNEQDKDQSVISRIGEKIGKTVVGTVEDFEGVARKHCEEAVAGPGNPLMFFSHMNPKLSEGMHLASSGPCFVENAIKSALDEVSTDAFKKIIEQLGFILPQEDQLNKLKESVQQKLEAFDHSILFTSDNTQNGEDDRNTIQKKLIVEYIERQILVYKNYDFFVRGYCYMMEKKKLEKKEGIEFKDFLGRISEISLNKKFKDCVKLYLDSVEKISEISPMEKEIFTNLIKKAGVLRHEANFSLLIEAIERYNNSSDEKIFPENRVVAALGTAANAITEIVQKPLQPSKEAAPSSSQESDSHVLLDLPAPISQKMLQESGRDDLLESEEERLKLSSEEEAVYESLYKKEDGSNIIIFLKAYITFLETCGNTNSQADKTPLLADLFLSKYLENVDLENAENIMSFKQLIEKIINTFKEKDGVIVQGVRSISKYMNWNFGGSRWSELPKGLERYIKRRTTFEFDNASLEAEASSPEAAAAAA